MVSYVTCRGMAVSLTCAFIRVGLQAVFKLEADKRKVIYQQAVTTLLQKEICLSVRKRERPTADALKTKEREKSRDGVVGGNRP